MCVCALVQSKTQKKREREEERECVCVCWHYRGTYAKISWLIVSSLCTPSILTGLNGLHWETQHCYCWCSWEGL